MRRRSGKFQSIILILISLLIGILTWVIVEENVGIEAWDHKYYWIISYPILIVTSFGLAVIDANKKWLWSVLPLISQAGYVLFSAPESANLLPLTVVFYCILLIPALLSSYLGAWISNKIKKE